jgi:hypothetical protein
MAVNKVDLYVSQILEDLDNGLTWLKSDDIGYGSIQEKYNAKEQQIAIIRKGNAKLRNAETNITVFNIIDDTNDETTVHAKEPVIERTNDQLQQPVVPVGREFTEMEPVSENVDSLSAFADL